MDPLKEKTVNLSEVSVLIVDTDEFSRNFMRQICRGIKFNDVFATGDIFEAHQILEDNKADLIICDWMLTNSGAVEFIRHVRSSPTYPNPSIPIVVLSAINDARALIAARDAGISAWIARPIVLNKLVTSLEACVKAPRPFVKSDSYAGPCRRRKQRDFSGQERRGQGRPQAAPHPGSIDLSKRAGKAGSLTLDEMVKAGETVIKQEETRYRDIRKNDLEELFVLIRELKDSGTSTEEMLGRIYRKINDLKGWGHTFGYPFLTKVGGLASDFMLTIPSSDAMKNLFFIQAIEIYATVMKMVIDSDMRDENDELAGELLSELQALKDKAATYSSS